MYDGNAWTQVGGDASWGTIHSFAEYSPSAKLVWLGGGNNDSQKHARLSPDGSITQLNNAPFSLSSNGDAFKLYEPASGNFLVRNNKALSWHEFNVTSDSWTDVTAAVQANQPASFDQGARMLVTAVDACHVLLILTHDATERHAYLYKHE